MIIVKLIAGALATLSGWGIGWYYSNKDTFHIEALTELNAALLLLKSEIDYSVSALPEAMRNVAAGGAGKTRSVFSKAALYLARGDMAVFPAWEAAVREELANDWLDSADLEALIALGHTLGYIDRRFQLKSIDMLTDQIDVRLAELRERSAKNKKLYVNLGVMAGLLITVIML